MKDLSLSLSELEFLYRVLIEYAPKSFKHVDDGGSLVDNDDTDHLRLLSKVVDELILNIDLPF